MNTQDCIKHLTEVCCKVTALEEENRNLKKKYNDLVESITKLIVSNKPKTRSRIQISDVSSLFPAQPDDMVKNWFNFLQGGQVLYFHSDDEEIFVDRSGKDMIVSNSSTGAAWYLGSILATAEIAKIIYSKKYSCWTMVRDDTTLNFLENKLKS